MSRIDSIREYMFDVLDELLNTKEYQINADFLDKDIKNYSLDRIPVSSIVSKSIGGDFLTCRDVYSFRSRRVYGFDVLDNLANIGFFEEFERKILENNIKGILPEIDGIEEIECLNCGALNIAGTQTAEFSVQIQIIYEIELDTLNRSLFL